MKPGVGTIPVIEWAPGQSRLFDPETGVITAGNQLSDFSSQLRGRARVVIAVSRRSSFVRTTRLPDLSKVEMKAILAHQLVQLMPMPPGEASVDLLQTDDVTPEGRLVFVAAIRNVVLREIYQELKQANLTAAVITPASFASCKIAQQMGLTECAVVARTPEGVAIDLVSTGVVRSSRVVPLSDDPSDIEAEVFRTFTSVKFPVSQIVCSGDLVIPNSVHAQGDPLSALSDGEIDLQLELPEVQSAREQKALKHKQGLAMLLWVALFGISAVIFDIRNQAATLLQSGQDRWEKNLNQDRINHKFAEQRAKELRAEKDILASAFEPKQPLDDVLAVVTTLTPKGIWLTAVTLERGKRASVRGTSLNRGAVTNYVSGLSKQSRLREVKLNFANSGQVQETPVVNFSLGMHIIGNFPLPADDKKKKTGGP